MTTEAAVLTAGAFLGAYLVGSIPFGMILGLSRGVDLRKIGSGNVGATNVARVLGRGWGFLCFALDASKGLVPVLAARGVLVQRNAGPMLAQVVLLAAGFGAIAGHVLSFWLRFRGGKGVATALGVVIAIPQFTWAGLVALGLWVAVTLASRYVSLGSIVAALAFVPLVVAFQLLHRGRVGDIWPLLVFAGAMALLILLRHRANLRRLLAGTENKIGSKARP